jgi:phosphodiesterase/alkaline phosphatase D-like protein
VITNVVVTPSTTGATVTWTTNENSDSEVRYGTTTSYGLTTGVAPSLVTLHSATLSGLTAGQTYNLQVRSKDAAGNVGISGNLSFKTQSGTQSGSDKTGPVLSNIRELSSQTSATVNWTTNEAARSQVLYGLTTTLGSITSLTSTLTTSHSVTLTGLKPNTIYYYRLRSVDASGNVTTTAHLSLRTTK